MADDGTESDATDRQNSAFVSSYAAGAVGPLMRGAGGAKNAARDNRLVWWLCGLALIPLIGLFFATIAILVAGLDLVSGREGAGREFLAAVVVFVLAAVVVWLLNR